MYRQPPTIETTIEALDELADIRMTLNGLAALTLALANSEMHEPEAIKLTLCLLDYCALVSSAIYGTFEKHADFNHDAIRVAWDAQGTDRPDSAYMSKH